VQVVIANTAAITSQVAAFQLDLGLIEGPCHEPELTVQPWLEDELLVVRPARPPGAGGAANNAADAASGDLAAARVGSGTGRPSINC